MRKRNNWNENRNVWEIIMTKFGKCDLKGNYYVLAQNLDCAMHDIKSIIETGLFCIALHTHTHTHTQCAIRMCISERTFENIL